VTRETRGGEGDGRRGVTGEGEVVFALPYQKVLRRSTLE